MALKIFFSELLVSIEYNNLGIALQKLVGKNEHLFLKITFFLNYMHILTTNCLAVLFLPF